MKKLAALAVLMLTALALVACGSSSDESSSTAATGQEGAATGGGSNGGGKGGGGSTVKLEADPSGSLAYAQSEATAKAGEVTVDFDNPQALTHDVAIENASGEEVGATELIAEGEDSTTVDLKPGTYTYFCTVPGHREAGMEGTLVVK